MDKLEVQPLTPDRWDDLVALFGPNGAYAGCWCMWPRQTSAEFERSHGDRNREAFRRLVDDTPPGLLAYEGGEVVGWVSVGPQRLYGRLERSPVTGRGASPDDLWAIVCFYIRRDRRRRKIASALVDAATDYAQSQGASAVEGYPLDRARMRSSDAWWGLVSMFRDAGFTEVGRSSPTRPVMRRTF